MNIIITGAPGTGKSTLIKYLKSLGFFCFDEVSREIITTQQRFNGNLVPWGDTLKFAEFCFEKMLSQLNAKKELAFFDRGIPDLIAYLEFYNFPVPTYFYKSIQHYFKKVFYCPIWEEVYVNDPQRPQTLEIAKGLDYFLRKTYTELEFDIIELEKISVDKRAEKVLNNCLLN
ncbi:MAG TPA: ATP-binding protein [Ignavibacteriales bacterium]|nr:ATP-binding protein [Ignavibacteriales bacterium]